MRPPEIAPFEDSHLDDAARLLAARHRRQRELEPLLSPHYEDPAQARAEVEREWRAEGASGAAAFRDGRLVGYLIGAPRTDPVWGANVWVEGAGHAVEEPEDVRDLYASAAARWVEEGRTRHWALVAATDTDLLETWSRLCFGRQHAHGIQEPLARNAIAVPDGFEIRAPAADEIDELIEIDLALPNHQRSSPVFSGLPAPDREEARTDWVETLAGAVPEQEEKLFIGAYGGRPVACFAVMPVEGSREHRGVLRPDGACFLGFASILPEFRGSGLGVAIAEASLAWAREQGYPSMVTDWRVTNLLSSRFWPRRGFRQTFFRLYRSIP